MKKYTGTKQLLAAAMALGAYNDYRGWDLPKDEDPNTEGYLVEYTDGGKPNHKDHQGYISWSPKDVFDKSYHPAETPLDRMLIEGMEILERLKALKALLAGSKPPFISEKQWQLLKRQKEHMDAYHDVLNERIEDLAQELGA
ncbi:hypothetical protein QO189_07415 [Psychrobacter sp. Arc29]|uniref:crAss001_48 related protein n=1 Tax=Psychrobacter sp. Arc29 TaxID=3046690 RepID=UPI00352E3D37